jgi:hypothetical protein
MLKLLIQILTPQLKRKQAKNPYFALWVGNSELLVSTEQD